MLRIGAASLEHIGRDDSQLNAMRGANLGRTPQGGCLEQGA